MQNIMDRFSMKGKSVIVTGGAGLLGKQFSLTLAQAGAQVMVADLNLTLAQQQAGAIITEGLDAEACVVNVTEPASTKAMVNATLEKFGRLDVLINCAALDPKFDHEHQESQSDNAFENYSWEAWQASLNVNLGGAFLASQAAVQPMLSQGQGVIINICSTYGLVGPDQRIYPCAEDGTYRYKPVDYTVTKAGILGLTHYLAAYYAGKNIRVNALSPGGVYIDHDENFVKNYSDRTILGRMAHLDEMNGAILFLASDGSSYMTGANLIVDGGWTAW